MNLNLVLVGGGGGTYGSLPEKEVNTSSVESMPRPE